MAALAACAFKVKAIAVSSTLEQDFDNRLVDAACNLKRKNRGKDMSGNQRQDCGAAVQGATLTGEASLQCRTCYYRRDSFPHVRKLLVASLSAVDSPQAVQPDHHFQREGPLVAGWN